jgi:opacity protein-like surface antigen
MKHLTTSLLASLALLATASAGDHVYSTGKSYKAPVATVEPTGCFSAHELQFDTFGQASFGSSDKIGLFEDTAWGGGVGLNYFFHRNIGLGVDAAWLDAKESALGNSSGGGDHTVLHNFSGSVIVRLPIDSICLAPYAYFGGGYHVDGENWASAHLGVGVEYRCVPNKVGLFVDGRWTYLGDRFDQSDLNFWTVRAGLRLVF